VPTRRCQAEAENGYEPQRSYSIASGPSRPTVAITINNSMTARYLTDALGAGDRLELRGPIGGFFVWEPDGRPVVPGRGRLGHRPTHADAANARCREPGGPGRICVSAAPIAPIRQAAAAESRCRLLS
jgi:hypothetical protein